MREILQNNNFYMFKACNCGGKKTEKYRHNTNEGLRVDIRPNRGTWSLYMHNSIKASGAAQFLQDNLTTYL